MKTHSPLPWKIDLLRVEDVNHDALVAALEELLTGALRDMRGGEIDRARALLAKMEDEG